MVANWLNGLKLSARSEPFGLLSDEDNKKVIDDLIAHLPRLPYLLDPSLQSTDDDDEDDTGQQSAAGSKRRWKRTHHKERTELAQYAFMVLDQAAARFKPKVGGGPTPTACLISEAKAPLSVSDGIAYLQRPFPAFDSESSRLDPDALQRAANARWSQSHQGTSPSTAPPVLYEDVLAGLIDLPILLHLLVGCSPAHHARGPLMSAWFLTCSCVRLCVVLTAI